MSTDDIRDGEVALPFDPEGMANDARLLFIGHIQSPWRERGACPHNLREALQRGGGGTALIDAAFRAGLAGLEGSSHVILLYWLDRARRDLIVQRPRRSAKTSGVFALRSPVRPNPIGLAVVRVLGLDAAAGRIELEAIDCLDGTPLLDVKPYIAAIDARPDAVR
jgi:tRNA (adenine37-N6)-methyltransferase